MKYLFSLCAQGEILQELGILLEGCLTVES